MNNPIRLIDPDGMDAVGADGLTDDQWIQATNPGADGELKTEYQQQNIAAADTSGHGGGETQPNGYLSSLNNTVNQADPVRQATQAWESYADNPLNLVKDLANSANSLIYSIRSLADADTYAGMWNYIKASPAEKGVTDGKAISGIFGGFLTFGPLNEIGGLKMGTNPDGFYGGPLTFKTPIVLSVKLYASEATRSFGTFRYSTFAPDLLGKTNWFGRNMLHITADFQKTLGPWSKQTIPAGTQIQIELIGRQPGVGFGTWIQIYVPQAVKYSK
jgi:hypothetical protein